MLFMAFTFKPELEVPPGFNGAYKYMCTFCDFGYIILVPNFKQQILRFKVA